MKYSSLFILQLQPNVNDRREAEKAIADGAQKVDREGRILAPASLRERVLNAYPQFRDQDNIAILYDPLTHQVASAFLTPESADAGNSGRYIVPPEEASRLLQIAKHLRDDMERDPFAGPPSISFHKAGYRVRVVWNQIHHRPPTETFHGFLINVLKWTVGQEWYEAQVKKSPDDRHIIMLWIYAHHDWVNNQITDENRGTILQLHPTGASQELLSLADDLYRLQLVNKLPPELVRRLCSYERFQGARYEIAVASTFVRAGFEIEWLDKEKRKKHCEFNANHKATGDVIAVETKSRHRDGTLNQKGTFPGVKNLKTDMGRLYRDALEQNPGDKPFAIFIDLNVPSDVYPSSTWRPSMEIMLSEYEDAFSGEFMTYNLTCISNFAWHYAGSNPAAPGEMLLIEPERPRFPLRDPRTLVALYRAWSTRGNNPIDDVH